VQLETERQELAGSYQTAATLILDAVSNWLTTLEKIVDRLVPLASTTSLALRPFLKKVLEDQ